VRCEQLAEDPGMHDLYKMRYPDTEQLDATGKPKTALMIAKGKTALMIATGKGKTALMIACRKGLLTSVEYLLEVLSLLVL